MKAEVVVGAALAVLALVTAVVLRRRRGDPPRLVLGAVPREPLSAVPRASLLAKIDETFHTGRFCVLLGGGGAGKSHVAAAYVRAGRGTVVWVAAQDPSNTARAYAALAAADAHAGLAWLDGLDDALVVFDGATDPDALNQWLPARARVLVTTTVPDFEVLGGTLPVGGFDEAESVGFLSARSGREPDTGAADVARELGYLPLALAQAGGVLRRQPFAGYLDELPHAPPLEREPGEDHPPCVEDTTFAALHAVASRDSRALVLAELLAVLAPWGVRRELLHRLGPDPVAVDAALLGLTEAALAESDIGGEIVLMHRLTRRAVLGRLHAEGRLASALDRAFEVVEPAADLADHAAALWRHFRALPSAEAAPRLRRILRLRRRSVELLADAGALAQAKILGVEVLADHEAYLPVGHADTARAARSLDRAA